MWLKFKDSSTIPAREVALPEKYLLSCDYRRGADGRTIISIQRQIVPNGDQNELLENKIDPFWKVQDIQIELYSGDGLLKTMRGCPYSYSISDRGMGGYTVERAEILVNGKIIGGQIANTTSANSGAVLNTDTSNTSASNEDGSSAKSPYVYKASYDKAIGRLTLFTDHSLHTSLGVFTAIDFEIAKISALGVPLVPAETELDLYRTSHEQVVFTLNGALKDAVNAAATVTGTNNGAFKLICEDGWNHLVSEYQNTILEVTNTGTSRNDAKITRAVYDIPSAVLTLFTDTVFASTKTDGTFQSSDFDASKITIGGVHSFAWTNTQFMMASAGMAKIQILGNCIDFMNNYASANGKVGANGVNYTWEARAGWNTGSSTGQSGLLEITGYVDYKAPDAPVGFRVMAFDSSLHMMAEKENVEIDLAGYNYYVDGVKHNTTPYPDFMYDATGLQNGKSYNCYMTAVDTSGNESAATEVITIAPQDTNAPSAPQGLVVMDGIDTPNAMWTANQESDVVGYNIYIDGVKWNTELIRGITIDITGLSEGSHNYSVAAVDSSGNESPKSEVVNF